MHSPLWSRCAGCGAGGGHSNGGGLIVISWDTPPSSSPSVSPSYGSFSQTPSNSPTPTSTQRYAPIFVFPADNTTSLAGWGFGPSGSPAWTTDRCGLPGGAMTLRDNFYLTSTTPAPVGDAPRTFAGWVRCSDAGRWGEIFGSGRLSCSQRFGLMAQDGRFLYFVGHCNDQSTSTRICDGTWHHIAVTYGAGVLKLFDQGVLVYTSTGRGFGTTPSFVRIGANGGGSDIFTGDVDDLRVYDVALPEDDVASLASATCIGLYSSAIASPPSPTPSRTAAPSLTVLPADAISSVPSLSAWLRPEALRSANGACDEGSAISAWTSAVGGAASTATTLIFGTPVRARETWTGACVARFSRAADTLLVLPVDLSRGSYTITIVARMLGTSNSRILSKYSSSSDWFMGWYGGCQVRRVVVRVGGVGARRVHVCDRARVCVCLCDGSACLLVHPHPHPPLPLSLSPPQRTSSTAMVTAGSAATAPAGHPSRA